MCQPQHPHKNETNVVSDNRIDGIIAISKSDRENEGTSPIVNRGSAFMPKRPEPPRLLACNPSTCGSICQSRSANG
ncbi:MAG: hypothetical protein AAFV90_25745 [Cyanobacteria bacterium J06634_5]